jgi:hypothetical protein
LPNRHALRAAAAAAKKTPALHERVIALRKQNCSIYDIQRALQEREERLSAPAIWKILTAHGFAKLPRRADEERPVDARVEAAPVADARAFSLEPRHFRTEFGGLFLFIPLLVALRFEAVIARVPLPGTQQIPAVHAIRSLLALKLFGRARHRHVMPSVFDEGLALFAGLNAIPKRSFLTEYSCRIQPRCYPQLMQHWFDALGTLGIARGESFHLDFHTIPFHGENRGSNPRGDATLTPVIRGNSDGNSSVGPQVRSCQMTGLRLPWNTAKTTIRRSSARKYTLNGNRLATTRRTSL